MRPTDHVLKSHELLMKTMGYEIFGPFTFANRPVLVFWTVLLDTISSAIGFEIVHFQRTSTFRERPLSENVHFQRSSTFKDRPLSEIVHFQRLSSFRDRPLQYFKPSRLIHDHPLSATVYRTVESLYCTKCSIFRTLRKAGHVVKSRDMIT